jgi:hypothetical protein
MDVLKFFVLEDVPSVHVDLHRAAGQGKPETFARVTVDVSLHVEDCPQGASTVV